MVRPSLKRSLVWLALATVGALAVACGGEEGDEEDDEEVGGPTGGGGRTSSSSSGDWGGGSTSSSSSSGEPWNSSSSSSSGGSSSSGTNGDVCNDPDDVGGMEDPEDVGTASDCEEERREIYGVLNGIDDEDVYVRRLTDDGSVVNPCAIYPSASTVTQDIELCMFLECVNGNTVNIKSCGGGVKTVLDDTRAGCCGVAFEINHGCTSIAWGGDDAVFSYIRVRATEDQCIPYTISTGQ